MLGLVAGGVAFGTIGVLGTAEGGVVAGVFCPVVAGGATFVVVVLSGHIPNANASTRTTTTAAAIHPHVDALEDLLSVYDLFPVYAGSTRGVSVVRPVGSVVLRLGSR